MLSPTPKASLCQVLKEHPLQAKKSKTVQEEADSCSLYPTYHQTVDKRASGYHTSPDLPEAWKNWLTYPTQNETDPGGQRAVVFKMAVNCGEGAGEEM